MDTNELLRILVDKLEQLGLTYYVTGSVASIAYGEPRFTNDIDVVVDLPRSKAEAFCAAFPSESYYLSPEAVIEAIRNHHQFNIIHPESGLKIDVIMSGDSVFDRSRLNRRRQLQAFADRTAYFAAPEDLILKKLVYYKEGRSEKHLRDIAGILRVQGDKVDRQYIAGWAARLDLTDEWQTVLGQSGS